MNLDYSQADQQALQSMGWQGAVPDLHNIYARQAQEQQDMQQQRKIALQQALYDQKVKEQEASLAQAKLNDPTYNQAALAGYKGQMQSQEMAGRKAAATIESDISATLAENYAKIDAGKQQQIDNDLTQSIVRFKATRNSPTLYQQEYEDFVKRNPTFAKLVDPRKGDISAQLETIQNGLTQRKVASDTKIQGELEKQRIHNQGQAGVASIQAKASVDRATAAGEDKQKQFQIKALGEQRKMYEKQYENAPAGKAGERIRNNALISMNTLDDQLNILRGISTTQTNVIKIPD